MLGAGVEFFLAEGEILTTIIEAAKYFNNNNKSTLSAPGLYCQAVRGFS